MKAVILYDEFDLAAKANALLTRAANRADPAVPWSINPWRLDMLMLPPTADNALQDTAGAHLIVLAIQRQRELPPWLFNWLEKWAGCREVQDVAFAVFDGGNGGMLSMPAAPELSRFAERHGLCFIFGDVHPDEGKSAGSLDDLHAREVTQTPTMVHILEQTPRRYYQHWGINE
ncbi:MAG: hypothetical protein MUF81_09185 [Verrucomicrobia bacterium]|nr:hypothetical protein [Verrucomicrobiota bacterium]